MASTLVLEALETLHKELNRMQPAIRQVEIAEQVIAEAKKIPEHYLKLVTRVEEQEAQFKQNLEYNLDDYANQIREEVGSLVTSADMTITNLTKQEEKFGVMRKSLEPLVGQLTSLKLEPRLDKLQDTTDKKFEQLANSTNLLQTGIKGIQDRLNATEVTIGNLLTEEKIRQDQLDTKANALQHEVRQLSSKLISLESTLTDQIRDQGKKQDEHIIALSAEVSDQFNKLSDDIGQINTLISDRFGQFVSHFELLQKQQADQKTYTYITWILIAAATAVIFFTKHP